MKKIYALFFVALCALFTKSIYAQKEKNIWYFGENAGIDFNTNPATPLTNSVMNTREGCASIADSNGSLLFYTNGITVWNKSHAIMNNGSGLSGSNSSAQSALIIPKPQTPGRYYIFTTGDYESFNNSNNFNNNKGLCYSEVDMSLNGGLGQVLAANKNTNLIKPVSERLSAIKAANDTNIWVVTHAWNNDKFYAYLVTPSGVNTTPVISTVGAKHWNNNDPVNFNTNAIGGLKISPDGKKLACTIRTDGILELYDFNNATGIISNPTVLETGVVGMYSVEFSPNSALLYASKLAGGGLSQLYQYDLTAANITNSKVVLGSNTTREFGTIQTAPDGKIYIARDTLSFPFTAKTISTIDFPDVYGVGCTLKDYSFSLAGKKSILGLPNFLIEYKKPCPDVSLSVKDTSICLGDSVLIQAKGGTKFTWTPTSNLRFLNDSTAIAKPDSSINYTVLVEDSITTCKQPLSLQITVFNLAAFSAGADQSVCPNTSVQLDATNYAGATYSWTPGTLLNDSSIHNPIANMLDSSQVWIVTVSANGGKCSARDTVLIKIDSAIQASVSIVASKDSICENESVTFTVINTTGAGSNPTFTWFVNNLPQQGVNGTQFTSSTIKAGDSVYVEMKSSLGTCVTNSPANSNEVKIHVDTLPLVDAGADVTTCSGTTIQLNASGGTNYQWSPTTGLNNVNIANPLVTVDSTIRYYVTITNGACSATDSVLITAKGGAKASFTATPNMGTKPLPVDFNNTSTNASSYSWNFGDGATDTTQNTKHTYTSVGIYTVTLVAYNSNGCNDTATAVIVVDEEATVFVPNVFTPNSDGNNDAFTVTTKGIKELNIHIYNRWGVLMFESNNLNPAWDGKYNGKDASAGTYYYILKLTETMER